MTASLTTSVLSNSLLPTRPQVLLIEDEPAQTYLVRRQLLERSDTSFDIACADSLARARLLLDEGLRPDVILLDLNLPDSSGSDTVTQCLNLCDAPVVVLTGSDNFDEIQKAIDSGAEDYLIKGAEASALRRAIRYAMLRHRRDADDHLATTVFNHTREGIIITRADGTILNVNNAFCHMTGLDHADIVGKTPALFNFTCQGRKLSRVITRQLAGKEHWTGECINRHDHGQCSQIALTINVVRNNRGHITHYVGLVSDITQRKQQEEQLRHLAHHDQLTGLPNRTLFNDRLRQLLARADRTGRPLAIAYIDLDGFKQVNDQHGHDAGDQLLAVLARRLLHVVREGDTVARIGGDEFAVILVDLGPSAAETRTILERLLLAAAEKTHIDRLTLQVSASIGISFYPQSHNVDIDQLLRQADQAMYQAKLAGKHRYAFFADGQ